MGSCLSEVKNICFALAGMAWTTTVIPAKLPPPPQWMADGLSVGFLSQQGSSKMTGQFVPGMALVALSLAPVVAWADDFRVETDVFVGKQKDPVATYLTLFSGKTIYDFVLSDPKQVTVFDTVRGRFILLDVERAVKTELKLQEIEAFHAELRERAVERGEPLFPANVRYSFVDEGEWHVLSGEALEYRARGVTPKHSGAAEQYRMFADWYAQLNAMRPGNPPPYARMELNKTLAERNLIPEEIQRTLSVGRFPTRKSEARTQHLMNWILSEQDQKQIRRVGNQLQEFSSVPLQDFFARIPSEPTDAPGN
jgi:hypothetical protein